MSHTYNYNGDEIYVLTQKAELKIHHFSRQPNLSLSLDNQICISLWKWNKNRERVTERREQVNKNLINTNEKKLVGILVI